MEPYTPTFSPRVRATTYVVCLLLSVLTALVCTVLAIARVIDVVTAVAITAAVSTACASVAGGLGVAYRPTRVDIAPNGAQVLTAQVEDVPVSDLEAVHLRLLRDALDEGDPARRALERLL